MPIGAVTICHDDSFFFTKKTVPVGTIVTGSAYGGQSEKMVPVGTIVTLVGHYKTLGFARALARPSCSADSAAVYAVESTIAPILGGRRGRNRASTARDGTTTHAS